MDFSQPARFKLLQIRVTYEWLAEGSSGSGAEVKVEIPAEIPIRAKIK